MATLREIESKLEVSVDLVLPDLAGLPGVTSVDGSEVFETDLCLVEAGMTLRRRTGGSDAGWHLKIPVSVDERTEIQAPLGPVDGQVPGELLAVVRSHFGDAQLGPVVLLHTRRSVRRRRPRVAGRCRGAAEGRGCYRVRVVIEAGPRAR